MRTNSTSERFKNRKEALVWLQSRGQISAGKFYQDCVDGLITIAADKTVSKFQVAEYADRVFGSARQTQPSIDAAMQKEQLENKKLKLQIERMEIDNRKDDTKYILRETAEDNTAALMIILRDTLRHHAGDSAPAIILAASGNSSRAVEVEAAIQDLITIAFNETAASHEFSVVFQEVNESVDND